MSVEDRMERTTVGIWRVLAREFIADRLGQCLAAWECAAGVWRLDKGGMPERDPGKWNWDELVKFIMVTLEEDVV